MRIKSNITCCLASIVTTCAMWSGAFAASPEDEYSFGIEGFHDRYREPSEDATLESGYGSITGGYTHYWSSLFGALDGRVSYGRADFSAPSAGDSPDMPQWEYDLRARAGTSVSALYGTFSPYTGIGVRYYNDEEKGTTTTLGVPGCDTRVWQFYIPAGVTYSFVTQNGWAFTPTVEYDQFVYGHVDSRLQNIPNAGYPDVTNTQHYGYGWRGELMAGKKEDAFSWEAGPFVRYWNIRDSDVVTSNLLMTPANERLQVGLALRVSW